MKVLLLMFACIFAGCQTRDADSSKSPEERLMDDLDPQKGEESPKAFHFGPDPADG